jgi:hypothetical protein
VEQLIAYGDAVGGAQQLVSLDGGELQDCAGESTGLRDFGEDGWRAHYDVFIESLERDSDLHLVGRLLARTEILRSLRNRLLLTQVWRERPELLEAPIEAPVFIVGGARTGTSILFELMACDAATRSPAMWEMQHPVEALRGEDWSAVSHRFELSFPSIQPQYATMHRNSGHQPNECIFMTMLSFLSDVWGSQYGASTYQRHLARADPHLAYQTHRRFLQTLQGRAGPRRWLLKAPSHQFQLRTLFDVYPDARVIRTHRDPLASLPSMLSLTGTLLWMRCQHVDLAPLARTLPAALAAAYRREIDDRASGALPDERFIDVQFGDVVRDPAGTIGRIYQQLGWPHPPETRDAIARHAASRPRAAHGEHRYSLEGTGLEMEAEAERFRFYLDRYGVPREPAADTS